MHPLEQRDYMTCAQRSIGSIVFHINCWLIDQGRLPLLDHQGLHSMNLELFPLRLPANEISALHEGLHVAAPFEHKVLFPPLFLFLDPQLGESFRLYSLNLFRQQESLLFGLSGQVADRWFFVLHSMPLEKEQ